jgi:hypothetical protein
MRGASIVLAFILVPSVAWAESDDPCRLAEYVAPKLHSSNEPLVRDGWIAFDLGHDGDSFTQVRLRDQSGREIEAPAVFGSGTRRTFEVFEPVEVLEPGSYELILMHLPGCFDAREVTMPVQVADQLAEPITVPPVITEVDADLWYGDFLELVIDIEERDVEATPAWLQVEADFVEGDLLFAPGEFPLSELDGPVDGMDVTTVCARATYYDRAGNPSTTTELCTDEIEPRQNEENGASCRVGGGASPSWAFGLLLGLALYRRRGRGIAP